MGESNELLKETQDFWTNFCTCGDSTVDKAKAEEVCRWLYRESNLKEPEQVLFVESPLQALIVGLLRDKMTEGWGKPSSWPKEPVTRFPFRKVWESAMVAAASTPWFKKDHPSLEDIYRILKPEVRQSASFMSGVGLVGDVGWSAYKDYMRKAGKDTDSRFDTWIDFLLAGVWDSLLLENMAVLVARPTAIKRNVETRLHCTTGPAIPWADGWGCYYVGGVLVPPHAVESPESITAEEVLSTANLEVRRVLIDQMGRDKFVAQAKFAVLHEDDHTAILPDDRRVTEHRRLLSIDMPGEDEPMVMVEVVCPSTGRQYLLRVPPTVKTCAEGVAWTFTQEEQVYTPSLES